LQYVIGTRGSKLALFQAGEVFHMIHDKAPEVNIEIKIIKTLGDRKPDLNLLTSEGKGVFCSDIEKALLNGEIDLAVHSIKDLPGSLPDGLVLAAFLEREDPREVLVSREGCKFVELPVGARIGTSSVRRLMQLRNKRPDLVYLPIRGNVETRIHKVMTGEFDATILALAGIRRLGLEETISEYFPVTEIIPAPGQGCIGVEVREKDIELRKLMKTINHEPTATQVLAERAFLQKINGNCETAAGVYTRIKEGMLELTGLFGKADGQLKKAFVCGSSDKPEKLGLELAERLLKTGS
jgi:hydroxymethylbilane synthase